MYEKVSVISIEHKASLFFRFHRFQIIPFYHLFSEQAPFWDQETKKMEKNPLWMFKRSQIVHNILKLLMFSICHVKDFQEYSVSVIVYNYLFEIDTCGRKLLPVTEQFTALKMATQAGKLKETSYFYFRTKSKVNS